MSEEHRESIFRKDKPILTGKHSAMLKMGNNHSRDAYIFPYTSLKVQKVQLVLCKQGREFSFSFCFCHRATDLRASLTIEPCGNHPKINPACANTFKTGRISESHRKARCTSMVHLSVETHCTQPVCPWKPKSKQHDKQRIYPRNWVTASWVRLELICNAA